MTKKETFEKLLKIIKKEKFLIISDITCLFIFPVTLVYFNTNLARGLLIIILFFFLLSKLFDTIIISVNKEVTTLQSQIINSYKKYFEDNIVENIKQNINQETKV